MKSDALYMLYFYFLEKEIVNALSLPHSDHEYDEDPLKILQSILFVEAGLCIKPVTEPNRTEPTEITEHIRPNLRKLSNIRTGPMAIMIFRYRELTALPVKMTKILKFKHLFQYLQRILCNFTAKLSLMKDHKGLFVYLFVLKYLYYNGVIVFSFPFLL